MAEKDKSPPGEEIAPSRMNETTIAIEEAETDIKEAAKEAAYKNLGELVYYTKVKEILKKRLARVRSPTLLKTAVVSLTRFAKKQYEDELKLVKIYADWFRMVSEAKSKGIPGANILYRSVIKEVGSVKEQIGFKLAVVGGMVEPVVLSHADLRSDAMEDLGIDSSAYHRAIPLKEMHDLYLQKVEFAKNQLIDSGATYGEGVSLRNIAEMTVRYEQQKEMIADLQASDVKLVYIEPHANCSKRCEKYQVGGSKHPSGLYSLNGKTGVTPEDHVKYVPLEFATNNPEDQYTTQEGKVYQNGCILGYNCRHRLVPYKPFNKPIPIPARVIKENREVEMTQREMEREIRRLRGEMLQATNPKDKTKFRKAIKDAEGEYIAFSNAKKIPYYIRRTEIF